MSAAPIRAYRFKTKDQWSQCVLHRFDVQSDGSLAPAARLGSYAYRVAGTPSAAIGHPLAIDPYGQPFLLADPTGPLAQSPRLIVDREWVWAFVPGGTSVQRSDSESLQLDLEIDVEMQVLDIAGDGREGIWILCCKDEILYLLRYDCEGRQREQHRAPYEGAGATQIVSVNRGLSLALLNSSEGRLTLVDGASGGTLRSVDVAQIAPAWTICEFTSDGRDRIALWGLQGSSAIRAGVLVVLDANGDLVDGPISGLFDQPNGARPPRSLASIRAAVYRQNVWLSTDTGLWRLDSSEMAGALESDSSLLTPVLYSPATSTDRGWLRAEVFADLDQGAALEVQIATTDNPNDAREAASLLSNPSISWPQKLDAIWKKFGGVPNTFSISGPATADVPVAFPLLEPQNQWAILRISVITPPGTPPSPLREVRILYPNLSIVKSLPAIFRGEQNDPSGVLRTLAGVLESTTQQFDERIRNAASYLDARATPDEWLDYLARWLDLPWDDALPVDSKRRILLGAGGLLERRGTRAGLSSLLQYVLGDGATIEIVDLTVDRAPIRLGGCGGSSGVLPALLAGVSRRTPTLGEKAVLGRARLCSGGTALDAIVPTLRIRITASQQLHQTFDDLLRRILLQYVPAGLTISVRWVASETAGADFIGDNGILLDSFHLAKLGEDSVGYSRLGGRDRGRIGDAGFGMGRLQ